MILLNDLLCITQEQFKREWTVCLNNDISEDVCSLIDSNETNARKERLLEHISWCKKSGSNSRFRAINTDKCLQFLRIKGFSDRWLFLGAFDRKGETSFPDGHIVYDLEKNIIFDKYAERLVVKYVKTSGDKQAKLSWNRFTGMEVIGILPDIYSKTVNPFPGYDNIRLDFSEMVRIFKTPFENWKDALSVINGIYVIADRSNGKLYVGSTYGKDGVWQRWMSYVDTNGHGNDIDLKPLIDGNSNYAYDNFQFTLVEYFFNIKKGKNDSIIIEREKFWKEALLTRTIYGYNHN